MILFNYIKEFMKFCFFILFSFCYSFVIIFFLVLEKLLFLFLRVCAVFAPFIEKLTLNFDIFFIYLLRYCRLVLIISYSYFMLLSSFLIFLNLGILRDILFIFYRVQATITIWCILLLIWTYEVTIWFFFMCWEYIYNWICKILLLILIPLNTKFPTQLNIFFNIFNFFTFGLYLKIFKIVLSTVLSTVNIGLTIINNIFIVFYNFLLHNISIILFGVINIAITSLWIFWHAPMLFKFIVLTLIAIINLAGIDKNQHDLLKICGLFWSFVIFNCFLFIIYFVENIKIVQKCSEILMYTKLYSAANIYMLKHTINFNAMSMLYGLDVISLLFILLTTFLFIIVFLNGLTLEMLELKKFYILIYIIYGCLLNVFLTQNLFLFFFFFESIVFPMFFLIMLGGSRFQKTKAAYYFFFFTVIGSLLMFISINYLLIQFGSLNLDYLFRQIQTSCTLIEQRYLWLTFFLSFAIKIPMFPFHTWLPEAHVEAPTIGSVILAGILLKLGTYGFIRISLFLFPEANVFFSPYVYMLCIISIFYSCFIAIRQTDIKRIIAYASVAHMNLIVLGLFSFNSIGIYGGIFQSISHGLVSSGLFILVGMLYSRYKSRLISYYSGLTQIMPLFSSFFLMFVLANISFPLTSNFIGELLLFIGISKLNFSILFLSLLSIIVNAIYSLWFCNRILYGNLKSHMLVKFNDVSAPELFLLTLLLFSVLLLGIFPNLLNIGLTQPLNVHLMFLEIIHKPYL